MPTVNIDGVGAVNFPDSMSHDQIVAVIENEILPNKVRMTAQARQQNPDSAGPSAYGDPHPLGQMTLGDAGEAIGRGLAHIIGVPTSRAEVAQKIQNFKDHPGMSIAETVSPAVAAGKFLYNAGHDLVAGNPSPVQGSPTEEALGHVPVVGRALQAIGAPAAAYASGQAPTREQNINAIEGGTQVAGTAALMHPAVGAAIEGGVGKVGAALDRGATTTYADALAARGTEMRPLAETIGDQLASKGKIMSNPKSQLRTAFDESRGPQLSETTVEKFVPKKNPNRVAEQQQALQEAHPNAEIVDDGDHFTIREVKPAAENVSVNQQGADALAANMPKGGAPSLSSTVGRVGRDVGASAIGSAVGAAFGHPAAGAAIAGGVVEAVSTMKRLIQSPLWKTTSAVLKREVGQAMIDQDFQKVASIGARVLAGANLYDAFGHDSALHGLVSSLTQNGEATVPPPILSQLLQQHDAVYVNPDGSTVAVPYNVQKQTYDQLSTGHH